MKELERRLILSTDLASSPITVSGLGYGAKSKTIMARFAVVTAITSSNGETYTNPTHSADIEKMWTSGRKSETSVTLCDIKTRRLIAAFQKLRPGHKTDCHDFTAEVEGWTIDRAKPLQWSNPYIENEEDVEPGIAYGIIVELEASAQQACTHSGIGTDSGQLLSVLGRGSALAVTDLETAKSINSRGREVYVAEILGT